MSAFFEAQGLSIAIGQDRKLENLSSAGLLDPESLKKGQLAKLSEFTEHECDETCESGGT